MAKATVSKLTPATKPKPDEVRQIQGRTEMAGERLLEIAAHLEDLQNLCYENQDGSSGVILGVENLLGHYAARVEEIGKVLKGGVR